MLEVRRLPARLGILEVAELLGFTEYDIRVLVGAKLLKPLGAPKQNSLKTFFSGDIQEKGQDHQWMDRATKKIQDHNTLRNHKTAGTSIEDDSMMDD